MTDSLDQHLQQLRDRRAGIAVLARELLARKAIEEVTATLSAVHRDLHEQAFTLAMSRMKREGAPPDPDVAFAFVMLGSGARDEQSIVSDQDHALVYDTDDARWEPYFTRLSELTTAHLHEIGYPLCKGNVMASNVRWRGSPSRFAAQFSEYEAFPDWDHIRYLLIASDARTIAGMDELTSRLRSQAVQAVARSGFMKWKTADQGLAQRVSLTLLGHLRTETAGAYKGLFGVKEGLYTPLVSSVRVWALSVGIEEPATVMRIASLVRSRVWTEDLAASVLHALRVILRTRVRHHVALAEADRPIDDYVDPLALSTDTLDDLKRAHRTVRNLQQLTAKHFPRGG